MDTARRNIRCQVYLHPTAISNPDAIRAVQQATGHLIVLSGGKPQLLRSQPLRHQLAFIDECDGPFGGDAA